ncbi:MAG: hypothetical protein D6723_02690 [Acidobacteria bacterium]|nr:MAG: hypothetical protein D6723_02690 [Acidobacteriota bacterium]
MIFAATVPLILFVAIQNFGRATRCSSGSRQIDRDPVRFGVVQLGEDNTTIYCDRLEGLGAGATWMKVPWKFIQPAQNQWNFDLLDELVDEAESCGIELAIKLRTGQGHWGVRPGGNGKGSRPPRNLDDYAQWVFTVVSRYRGRVRAYALENEVSASSFWAGSYDDYEPLWRVGHEAIKAADPDAVVVDFGMPSPSYGIAIARWRYDHGDVSGAIDWLNRYFAHRTSVRIETEQELRRILFAPEAERTYDIMMRHFQNPALYDAYQLHFYEPWDLLPEVFRWIRARMAEHGEIKPIEVWEIGYAFVDDRHYDEEIHGRDTVKLLVTALGEGARNVFYLPFTSARARQGRVETVRGLVDADGHRRPAYFSYQKTAAALEGFASARRISGGPEEWAYQFDDVLVRWTRDGEAVFERTP